ncbi:methyltransferase, partial [Bordetella pertussis]
MDTVWMEIWTTVRNEFADIPDVAEATRIVLRLGMAVALGGLLGYERERSGKAAGLRTHMLVALGAALFGPGAAARRHGGRRPQPRAAGRRSPGIGFLGAGVIIKLGNEG